MLPCMYGPSATYKFSLHGCLNIRFVVCHDHRNIVFFFVFFLFNLGRFFLVLYKEPVF